MIMLTKWYKEILKYLPVSASNAKYGPLIKTVDGEETHAFVRISYSPWIAPNFVSAGSGFRVGSGVTPPTEQDYSLESRITSGLSGSISTSTTRNTDGNIVSLFAITLTNTTSGPITVGEIGYYGVCPCYATEGGASSDKLVMFHRAVLNTPVTINAGEAAIINFNVTAVESSNE